MPVTLCGDVRFLQQKLGVGAPGAVQLRSRGGTLLVIVFILVLKLGSELQMDTQKRHLPCQLHGAGMLFFAAT